MFLMAVHAALGKERGFSGFVDMCVVTGITGHLAHSKAFAGGQEPVLIAVDINVRSVQLSSVQGEIVGQGIAGLE